jgi:hypothetical protein
MEVLRKTTKPLRADSKPVSPEYEARMLLVGENERKCVIDMRE